MVLVLFVVGLMVVDILHYNELIRRQERMKERNSLSEKERERLEEDQRVKLSLQTSAENEKILSRHSLPFFTKFSSSFI